jgi:hypothetical protein
MKDRKWFVMYSSKNEAGEVIILPIYYPSESGADVIMTFPTKESADKVRVLLNKIDGVIDSKSVFLRIV